MRNQQKDSFFKYLISGMDSKMQAQLNYMYSHMSMRDNTYHIQEMEQMKKEITEDVLSRISVTVDAEEVFQKIDKLQQAINRLGQ